MKHFNGLVLIFGLICVASADTLSNFISGVPEGVPGVDYPEYTSVPKRNSFTCRDRKPGFYADPDTRCQAWFWCDTFLIKHSFLCPNLTVFNQKIRGCDWWYNVDCTLAISQYVNNDELYQQSPAEKARETSRKEKELLDRQRGWSRPKQRPDEALFSDDFASSSSLSSLNALNDADNDIAFSTTLHPDLILSPTPQPVTFPPATSHPAPAATFPLFVRRTTLPPATFTPLVRQSATPAPATHPPATLPPATPPPAPLPPAILPPATIPPATIPPATLPPVTSLPIQRLPIQTLPPATFPPLVRQPATPAPVTSFIPLATTVPQLVRQPESLAPPAEALPPATPSLFTSPQWVPAIPLPSSTPRAIIPPQARPPAPFFFRPIANAIPIHNFPTPARTRRPPTTPLPVQPTVSVEVIQPVTVPSAATPAAPSTLHQQDFERTSVTVPAAPPTLHQQDIERTATGGAIVTAFSPTVTISGRRRRPQTTVAPPSQGLTDDDIDAGLTGHSDDDLIRGSTPAFGTTLHAASRPLVLNRAEQTGGFAIGTSRTGVFQIGGSQTGSSSPETLRTVASPVQTSATVPVSNIPLRVHSSSSPRSSFQPFPTAAGGTTTTATPTTTTTTTAPPPTTPPTTRIPPSTVTSTLHLITTQKFDPDVAFGSRIDGQASENVAQSAELPLPSTTSTEAPPRHRKFVGGDPQTFPPFSVTTFSPKTTTQAPPTSVIFDRRRGNGERNVTSSTPTTSDWSVSDVAATSNDDGEIAANTFAATKLTKKATSKPARTFPSFPVTTFRPSTEFGQREDVGRSDVNEITNRDDDVTLITTAG